MRYFSFLSRISSENSIPRILARYPHFSTSSISDLFRIPKLTYSACLSRNRLSFARESTNTLQQESEVFITDRVSSIADEISGLTLLEVSDLTEVLRNKLGIEEMPIMAVMMPGMGLGSTKSGSKGSVGSKGEEKATEKTVFDLKLESFDAASKIKVIKEVRSFTNLGLKEAKDLVEKAPTPLKKGVAKEEAEKIVEKMKEAGAKVTME